MTIQTKPDPLNTKIIGKLYPFGALENGSMWAAPGLDSIQLKEGITRVKIGENRAGEAVYRYLYADGSKKITGLIDKDGKKVEHSLESFQEAWYYSPTELASSILDDARSNLNGHEQATHFLDFNRDGIPDVFVFQSPTGKKGSQASSLKLIDGRQIFMFSESVIEPALFTKIAKAMVTGPPKTIEYLTQKAVIVANLLGVVRNEERGEARLIEGNECPESNAMYVRAGWLKEGTLFSIAHLFDHEAGHQMDQGSSESIQGHHGTLLFGSGKGIPKWSPEGGDPAGSDFLSLKAKDHPKEDFAETNALVGRYYRTCAFVNRRNPNEQELKQWICSMGIGNTKLSPLLQEKALRVAELHYQSK